MLVNCIFFKIKWVKNKCYKSGIGDNLEVIIFVFYMFFIECLFNVDYSMMIIRCWYGM